MPNLETVTLPAGLTSIPKDAFLNSAKLVTVNFGDASTNNGGGSGPSGRAVTGDANAITLPSKIATIGQNAFQGTAATAVDLSKVTATGFTTIDNSVFKGMVSLTDVKLPASITTINTSAFQGDTKLVMLSTKEAPASGGGNVQVRDETTPAANTATFGSKLISIGNNAFQGTGFTTVDLSKATGTQASTGGAAQTTPLTVGAGAFTNMADLTTVKLPANANINPADFGNPADATEQKLTSITYVGADSTTPATATVTVTTGNDANISSTNFSKIKNQVIEIKSSVGGSTINFSGGVFNGNETMTTLKLSLATGTRNGNNPL